jgi:hypothetical protein
VFRHYLTAQKHADHEHGGARIELDLDQPDLFDVPAPLIEDTKPL